MKKNKFNVRIALFGLLMFILGMIFCFVIFEITKFDAKDSKNESEQNIEEDEQSSQEDKIVELSIGDSVVIDLSNKVIGVYTNNLTSMYSDYFYKKDQIDIINENVSFKLSLAMENVSKENFEADGSVVYVEEQIVKDAYYNMYGESNTYARGVFSLSSCEEYKWSETNNRFEQDKTIGGCGGSSVGGAISKLGYARKVVSGNIEKIELYEYFAKFIPNDDFSELYYYSDYSESILIDSVAIEDKYENSEFFTKFKEKVGIYKYTFVKTTNNQYSFVNVEKVR